MNPTLQGISFRNDPKNANVPTNASSDVDQKLGNDDSNMSQQKVNFEVLDSYEQKPRYFYFLNLTICFQKSYSL